ncbi:hypothetical protein SYNPS1DRAFT_31434 [Syncephalis pseudoplumigaleata]|uniref:Uncharacterized protein n=1 Tax=Syncephalis pseudoplumigaleata TaxID=1712513 RepID=A0A4P9YUK5_9FUNG|nr:hypothetical protein SYNPS1DRAFT_31434 [Syncephalis pseudoplumigaleata]|eukprot:RKP22891.1 hypothetical protein SYNPS1DRAFT_31434 [Syncephalis pseudoplumigaleata]
MKLLPSHLTAAHWTLLFLWHVMVNTVLAQPQQPQQPQATRSSSPTATVAASPAPVRASSPSPVSPPIKTSLAIPPRSWRGVCADEPTDNLRYIVKSQNGTMLMVLLVEKAVYDKVASQPGLLMSGAAIERWSPLSCKERKIDRCARDSAINEGALVRDGEQLGRFARAHTRAL